MNLDFKFDHSQLSMVELHQSGIRSTRNLEEVFYDPFGKLIELTKEEDGFQSFVSFGFSDTMQPIKYFFRLEDEVLISQAAKIMTRQEIKRYYCG
jgi:hypothetical protein